MPIVNFLYAPNIKINFAIYRQSLNDIFHIYSYYVIKLIKIIGMPY
jgi:hypothetical protein